MSAQEPVLDRRLEEARAREPAAPPGLSHVQGFLAAAFQREHPVADDPEMAVACGAFVTGSATMSPAEQVDVYRQQFWLRHRASLEEDYPGLLHIVGEAIFDRFVRDYLAAFPPKTPSLRDLGADIVTFASRFDGFPDDRRALALDMIRYELAWVDVFDGPDPAPLDASVIQSMPPEAWSTARIRLNPCVARLSLGHPVHKLRYAIKAGEEVELPQADPRGVRVALYRSRNVLHYEELSEEAFALLEALSAGVPLVPACERVTKGKSDEAIGALNQAIGPWFSAWARFGFIAGIDGSSDDPGATEP